MLFASSLFFASWEKLIRGLFYLYKIKIVASVEEKLVVPSLNELWTLIINAWKIPWKTIGKSYYLLGIHMDIFIQPQKRNVKDCFCIITLLWRGGRVVECACLENRCPFTGTVGSNPSLSAIYYLSVLWPNTATLNVKMQQKFWLPSLAYCVLTILLSMLISSRLH